jgi:hypothetical protein
VKVVLWHAGLLVASKHKVKKHCETCSLSRCVYVRASDLTLVAECQVLSSMPGVEVAGTELHDQHDSSRIIDIVTRYKGHLLAVEVDGPTHFTWPGQRPTGITLARNRALGRRGYRVVCVPLNPGWDQQRGLREQQQYLQGLLDIALTSTDLHKTPTDSSISDSPKDDQPQ